MNSLEELKRQWKANKEIKPAEYAFDQESFSRLLRSRIKIQNSRIMQYFWGTFFLHIIIYALLCHVAIRFWLQHDIFWFALSGILLTIPFTVFLMRRFKKMAFAKVDRSNPDSILNYVGIQKMLLLNFFKSKKWFDYFLLPINSALGVIIVFNIFVPGGFVDHLVWALVTYVLTMASCIWAIRSENQKSFIKPLEDLQKILDEYE